MAWSLVTLLRPPEMHSRVSTTDTRAARSQQPPRVSPAACHLSTLSRIVVKWLPVTARHGSKHSRRFVAVANRLTRASDMLSPSEQRPRIEFIVAAGSNEQRTNLRMPPAKKSAAKTRKRGPAKMTAEHKKALAQGREESRHIAANLDALDAHRPKRGRKRTPESIKKRLAEVETALPTASGIKKLDLAQTKLDLRLSWSPRM